MTSDKKKVSRLKEKDGLPAEQVRRPKDKTLSLTGLPHFKRNGKALNFRYHGFRTSRDGPGSHLVSVAAHIAAVSVELKEISTRGRVANTPVDRGGESVHWSDTPKSRQLRLMHLRDFRGSLIGRQTVTMA